MNIACAPAPPDGFEFVKYVANSFHIVFRRKCCNALPPSPDEFGTEFFIVAYPADGLSDLRRIGGIKQDGRIPKLLIGTCNSRRSHWTSDCEGFQRRKIVRPEEAWENKSHCLAIKTDQVLARYEIQNVNLLHKPKLMSRFLYMLKISLVASRKHQPQRII